MHRYNVLSDDQSLAAATAETLLQIVTGATRRARLAGFKVSGKSVTSADAPMLIELVDQTSAGTSAAATIKAIDPADPAAIFTALKNFTAEPTDGGATAVRDHFRLTPVGGTIIYHIPEEDQPIIAISSRLGLRITADQAQSGIRVTAIVQE